MTRWRWMLLLLPLLLAACDTPKDTPVALGYSPAPPEGSRPTITLGVHPLHNPAKLFALFGPIIEDLDQAIPEIRIRLEASRDYADFENKLKNRQLELALPNPYQTLTAIQYGYSIFAKVRGDDDFRGIFVVRKDDKKLKRIEDLRGKTISYPSPTATAGGLMQHLHIQEHGVNVLQEVDNRYVGSQESAIMHVALGMSDVGSTWPPPWRNFQKDHPDLASQLEVRWETPSLPNNGLIARDDMSPALVERIRSHLVALSDTPHGQALLAHAELQGFDAADTQTYQPVREFLERYQAQLGAWPE